MPDLITENTIVLNCDGTTSDVLPGKSWLSALDELRKSKGKKLRTTCIVKDHSSMFTKDAEDLVGAHVHLKGKKEIYIVHMCKSHNNKRGKELNLKDGCSMYLKSTIEEYYFKKLK